MGSDPGDHFSPDCSKILIPPQQFFLVRLSQETDAILERLNGVRILPVQTGEGGVEGVILLLKH